MMARLFLILALLALALPARAEPCGAVPPPSELVATLKRAGEERPMHIQFKTTSGGVKLPRYLLAQYPEEMTVILQYQFDRLVLKNDRLEVGLWFKRRYARLTIPFTAITGFWDMTVRKCNDERRV